MNFTPEDFGIPNHVFADNTAANTPADFDGYLMVFVMEGEAPGIWRVTAAPEAWCETCSNQPANYQGKMYATVALGVDWDPNLGICHDCMSKQWAERRPVNEGPDLTLSQPYVYPPAKA